MKRKEYLSGQVVGVNGFIFISEAGLNKSGARLGIFKCPRCNCEKQYIHSNITRPSTKTISCGCYKKEMLTKNKTNPLKKDNPRLYRIYQGLKSRVSGKSTNARLWKNTKNMFNGFDDFLRWSKENGYSSEKEIHRIDNGNYCKEDCVWLTREEHSAAHNREMLATIEKHREEISIKYNNGELGTGLSREYNIPYQSLKKYILDILPTQKNKNFDFKGKKIAQIDIETNEIINIFNTAREAATYVGLTSGTSITAVCNHRQDTAKNFKWKHYR